MILRVSRLRHSLDVLCKDLVDSFPMISKDMSVEDAVAACQGIIKLVRTHNMAMDIPAAKNCMELLEEAIDDALTRGYVSKDKDARGGHKSVKKTFFGTKEHMALESETGLVCAAVVTSGEKTDDKYVESLVDNSRTNGVDVNGVIADLSL